MKQEYVCVFVNYKTGKSGLKKVITVKNDEKDMQFLDNSNDLIYTDEILAIGEIKHVSFNIE